MQIKNNADRVFYSELFGLLFSMLLKLCTNVANTFVAKKKTVVICIGLVLMSSLMTFAQGNGEVDLSDQGSDQTVITKPPVAPSLGLNSLEIASIIADGIDAKLASLSSSTGLNKMRDAILGVGLAIGLFWTGLKTMVAGKGVGELLGEWIPILITAGVVTAFTTPGPNSAGNQIQQLLNTVSSSLTAAAGGDSIDTSKVKGVVGSAVTTTFTAITAVNATPQLSEPNLSIKGILAGIPTAIFVQVMKMVTSFIIAISMCVYMATAIMAMVSINLVIALAPVMVPFLIFKPTAWLFDSWLKFLLGACMLKLVGAVMLSLTSGLMSSMVVVATKIRADAINGTAETYGGDILLFSVMLLIAVMSGLLMAQVPSIASGLLAGSAGGTGFSGLKGVSQNLGAKAATGTTNSLGQGTRVLAQDAQGWYQQRNAAKTAHKDAVAGGPLGGRGYSNQRAKAIYSQSAKEASAVQAALGGMEKQNRSRSTR